MAMKKPRQRSKGGDCCPSQETVGRGANTVPPPPDHAAEIKKLNRVIGQLQGVRRMIEERRYCPDILAQTRAAASALRAIELSILKGHVNSCVAQATASRKDSALKVRELIQLLAKF